MGERLRSDGEWKVRRGAARSLGALEPQLKDEECAASLQALLHACRCDVDYEVREEAVHALRRLESHIDANQVVDAVLELQYHLLNDGKWQLRANAAQVLGVLGPLLKDEVRVTVSEALLLACRND